jgi:hypothetical protein
MKSRRPHLFSDTEGREQAQLDRHTFEYHLETLTNRKQELDFEHFARKLAEKELCPNLLPQTGPTGGGDSKVDSETYRVSSDISDRWYYADAKGREGSNERWAFAFSTKADWKTKVRGDIKSISGTEREYSVAYFITSRFAKDKDKATVQDELRKAYGIEVRILDRAWIVDKVFTNGRERLAIETLRLDTPLVPIPRKGPRDTSREAELKELEQQISDPERYRGLDYQLVEDALQAALLARGLELPRVEVDGRFERALRLAQEFGTHQQQLRCAYNKAWTYFWWYDDFTSFNEAYDGVEKLAQRTSQTSDLELLQNLWQLLYASVRNGHMDSAEGRLVERTTALKRELERLHTEHGRPSVVLSARASLLLMDLVVSYDNTEELRRVLDEFRNIFDQSKGLIDFPALQFVDILMQLGEHFPKDESFDGLFESVLLVTRERESRTVSGRMLLRRGIQKLKGNQPYEAIRLLGRAQQDLALRESRGEMAAALRLCATAYEEVGLLWASRGSLLLAANQALKDFWERGKMTVQALACLRRLIWIELQLGRIPCALVWIQAFLILSRTADSDEGHQTKLQEEWTHVDGVLAALLLRTDIFDLKDLAVLPGVLEQFHLDASWMALLYALGYEDRLRAEEVIPSEESSEAVIAFFNDWVTQPGLSDLPAIPEYLDKQLLELRSSVLGCDVRVTLTNNPSSLYLAESILAGLEGFLATSLDSPLVPHTSLVQLRIVARDFMSEPLSFTIATAPHTIVEISHPREGLTGGGDPSAAQDKLMELISTITGYITVLPDDGQKSLETLIKDERGFGRALLIANVEAMLQNILGDRPKFRISDWDNKNSQKETFPLLRKEPWDAGAIRNPQKGDAVRPEPGKGEPPTALLDMESLKHRDRKVVSLINMDLWNKAGWAGTGFAISEAPDDVPYLVLMFKNRKAAESIFAGWRDEFGPEDLEERLRVSMVTGINSDNPAAYRVIISANPKWSKSEQRKNEQLIIVSRINEMVPRTSANLDRFLGRYRKAQRYLLLPGEATQDGMGAWVPSLGIVKRELIVRPAWQIGRHDPDMCGIKADDKIIIPHGAKDVPVLEVLVWKEKRGEKKGSLSSPLGPDVARAPHRKLGRNDPCYCGSGRKYKKCHGR